MTRGGLKIAVLIKQIPRFEAMTMTADGRLQRDGVELDLNAYCRRAITKGVELARHGGGSCTVFTLGPDSADEVLREAIARGADDGVLISDPAFAGSDSLATARALAAALTLQGPFDVILAGRNSIDADTGQVGPALAELLDLPFLGGVRKLDIEERRVRATCEQDDGWLHAETTLPAILSVAERLCAPAKAGPEERAAVDGGRIRRLVPADLGPGPWGAAASPTRVGEIRALDDLPRARLRLTGVHEVVALLRERGALDNHQAASPGGVPEPGDGPTIAVIIEPGRERLGRELCGTAARLGGRVVGLLQEPLDGDDLGGWGCDSAVVFDGVLAEEDMALGVTAWARHNKPWAILAPGTMWGREVAARAAAALGAGLTGDAIDVEARDGRLVAWKPAFGGRLVAAITATSPIQMATVRAGALPLLEPRRARAELGRQPVATRGRIHIRGRERDDELDALAAARTVIGVGVGVAPEDYPRLDALRALLDAELAGTRKVTDQGWLPRARQIGVTGRSIAPRLYIALGLSGKFNHVIGFRRAGTVLAINSDPQALIFDLADIAMVGDWREIVPGLVAELKRATA